jgi:NMD protein affecting ribosome stability and mRNA decay
MGGTIKCPICGRPYKWYAHYAGDQSACPACRREAEEAVTRPDTVEQRRRRYEHWR